MEFGYTEPEAQFLYVVATHSGYFIVRQYLNFTGAHRGKRSSQFARKILNNCFAGQARATGSGQTLVLQRLAADRAEIANVHRRGNFGIPIAI